MPSPEREPRSGAAVLLALALLLAASCKDVTSGVVISRDHQLPYSYITMSCIAHDSKTFACTGYMPVTNYVPESWTLCLRDDSEDKPVKDQSQGCISVDAQTWGRYSKGNHYP